VTDWERYEWLRMAVREAGEAILEVQRGGADAAGTTAKLDGSPLTRADSAAHEILAARLAEHTPDIPVLSEEGRDIPYAERRSWGRLWLVDPLDGTREFVKGLDEFTVNVALIEAGAPRVGVVYAPVPDKLYFGSLEGGALLQVGPKAEPRRIHVRPQPLPDGLVVVQSRSHATPEVDQYLRGFVVAERISAGSSLKFCLVAEGTADLYPRFGPTMEWDTAAAQAVVEAAGGEVVSAEINEGVPRSDCGEPLALSLWERGPLRYNKVDLLNPWFVARGTSLQPTTSGGRP